MFPYLKWQNIFSQHAQVIRELEQEMEIPILKTFQPLERKSVPKAVDKSVELDIHGPRRPVVPPPQPPITKPVCISFN